MKLLLKKAFQMSYYQQQVCATYVSLSIPRLQIELLINFELKALIWNEIFLPK